MPGPIWLQGPIAGVPQLLQPVAHALIEADQDVQALVPSLSIDAFWTRPSGAASVGYHIHHAAGSVDRLLTYARGEMLTTEQLATHQAEKTMDRATGTPESVAAHFSETVARAVAQLRATRETELLAPREVGRAKAPSDLLGILMHAALHTYRHVGQAISTAKVVGGS